MANLQLTIQTGDYEICRAIKDGSVVPKGIDLVFPTFPGTREIHMKVAEGAYDVAEFNAGAYMANRSQGGPMTALPIYPHRRFRHGFVFINTSKGITKPTDLIGKRVGGTNFGPAGNIWIRGILENEYDVPHETITWVTDRAEDGVFDYHPGLKVERIAADQNLDDMLLAGALDAIISPDLVRGIVEGDSRVARLFENYAEIELDYYDRTEIFPIMHVTVIREEIVDQNPWVVESLMDAFEQAKQIAFKRLTNPRIVPLAWYQTHWEEQRARLGPDPWEYGLSNKNKRNLEMLAGFVHQQGMSDRLMPLEELFPAASFDWQPPPTE